MGPFLQGPLVPYTSGRPLDVIYMLHNIDGVLTVKPALSWELEGNAGALALD